MKDSKTKTEIEMKKYINAKLPNHNLGIKLGTSAPTPGKQKTMLLGKQC